MASRLRAKARRGDTEEIMGHQQHFDSYKYSPLDTTIAQRVALISIYAPRSWTPVLHSKTTDVYVQNKPQSMSLTTNYKQLIKKITNRTFACIANAVEYANIQTIRLK